MAQKHPLSVLKDKSVFILIMSLFISQLSNQMQIVAINWHMYEKTHSPVSLGLLGLAGFLPILIFSLPAGTLVDKFNKKTILIISQAILSLNSLVLLFSTITGNISPVVLYASFAISAIVSTLTVPSRQSILPIVVSKERLINAISINNNAFYLGIITGPMMAGVMIALFGVHSVYLSSSLFFLISLTVLSFLQYHKHEIGTYVPFNITSIIEGLHFVIKDPLVYSTMLLDFFAMIFGSASTLMPIFARDILHVGPQGLGFLYSAPAIGGVLAGFIIAAKHKIEHQGMTVLISVIIYGVSIVAFGFSKIFVLSLLFLAVSGAADSVSAVIRNTIRQIATPNHLKGRMTAINMNFFVGGPYLGEIEAGFAARFLGTPLSVAAGGLGAIISVLILAWAAPRLRRYQGHDIDV